MNVRCGFFFRMEACALVRSLEALFMPERICVVGKCNNSRDRQIFAKLACHDEGDLCSEKCNYM